LREKRMENKIKNLVQMHFWLENMEREWIFPLATTMLVSLFWDSSQPFSQVQNNCIHAVLSYFVSREGEARFPK